MWIYGYLSPPTFKSHSSNCSSPFAALFYFCFGQITFQELCLPLLGGVAHSQSWPMLLLSYLICSVTNLLLPIKRRAPFWPQLSTLFVISTPFHFGHKSSAIFNAFLPALLSSGDGFLGLTSSLGLTFLSLIWILQILLLEGEWS